MSRIGKKIIELPKGTTVSVAEGNVVTVKGPKGELHRTVNGDMKVTVDGAVLKVERPSDERHHRALHGLTRALLANMVKGVSDGYELRLRIIGTGYRAEMQGNMLKLALGYSHDILVEPPDFVKVQVEERGALVILSSIDKEFLGQIAADIRKLRPPEPYLGKGIRFDGEQVRMKAGKSGKK